MKPLIDISFERLMPCFPASRKRGVAGLGGVELVVAGAVRVRGGRGLLSRAAGPVFALPRFGGSVAGGSAGWIRRRWPYQTKSGVRQVVEGLQVCNRCAILFGDLAEGFTRLDDMHVRGGCAAANGDENGSRKDEGQCPADKGFHVSCHESAPDNKNKNNEG